VYGIPATTDLSFLRDKTLTQVCFGPYDLQLNFCEEITNITTTSTIGYGLAVGTYAERSIGPKEGFVPVQEVSWTAEGTLTLEFEGAVRVQFYDDLGPYECYTITHNDDFFVM
jgi:hypothetical protein